MFCKAKSAKKKLFFAWRFLTIFKQKCSNLTPLLSITFPQGFRSSKNIGLPTSGRRGKKTFKRYLKSEHTDKDTDKHRDRQTNISTYRKHRPRGLMLWKSHDHFKRYNIPNTPLFWGFWGYYYIFFQHWVILVEKVICVTLGHKNKIEIKCWCHLIGSILCFFPMLLGQ